MEPKRSSDIDLLTLVIAAVASGVAAYVTSQVWAGGTLISASITPVIVALVKEALNRPVDRVTSLREARTLEQPRSQSPLHPPVEEPPVRVYGTSNRRWKVAIVSGLAAFLVVVAVFTVPELVAGKSVGRSGDSATTFFGGTKRKATKKTKSSPKKQQAPQATGTAAPEETVTQEPEETPTATPSATPTPTASATATPPATATPAP